MTREQYELQKEINRRKAFQQAAQPWIDNAVRIAALYPPTILIYADGRVERKPHPKVEEAMQRTQEVLDTIRSSCMNSRP